MGIFIPCSGFNSSLEFSRINTNTIALHIVSKFKIFQVTQAWLSVVLKVWLGKQNFDPNPPMMCELLLLKLAMCWMKRCYDELVLFEAGLPNFSQKWVLLPLFTSFGEFLFISFPLSLSDPFKRRYQKHVQENWITFLTAIQGQVITIWVMWFLQQTSGKY